MKAFIAVNLLIDVEPVSIVFFGLPGNLHQAVHTFGGVTVMAIVTLLTGLAFKGKFEPWRYGTFLGAYSHILLGALVHNDVEPFAPILSGNPLYLDAHSEVSILFAIVLTYYLAKWVESLHIAERWSAKHKRDGL